MILNIWTHKPRKSYLDPTFIRGYLRRMAKRVLKRGGGPEAVAASLKRGLNELDVKHSWNTGPQRNSVVGVLSDVEALHYAIDLKQRGLISKLLAGPNIIEHPLGADKILLSPEIDTVLVPSQWVRDLYVQLNSEYSDKVYIWAAGVHIPPLSEQEKNYDILVYKKHVPDKLFANVIEQLETLDLSYNILTYGSYSQEKYYTLLNTSRAMVYLQETESQGLALAEAWARDVPTLVWNKGKHIFWGVEIEENISAPYLSDEAGMFFTDKKDFNSKINNFMSLLPSFSPREYCTRNFSDTITSKHYLDIIST